MLSNSLTTIKKLFAKVPISSLFDYKILEEVKAHQNRNPPPSYSDPLSLSQKVKNSFYSLVATGKLYI